MSDILLWSPELANKGPCGRLKMDESIPSVVAMNEIGWTGYTSRSRKKSERHCRSHSRRTWTWHNATPSAITAAPSACLHDQFLLSLPHTKCVVCDQRTERFHDSIMEFV